MQRILMNGVEESGGAAFDRWGELLEHLDRFAAGDGKVLTAVRFDGVDQPSFRDPGTTTRLLNTLVVVEAESMSPAALLDASVGEAIAASRALATGAARVGESFRGFDVQNANQDLQDLAQGLATLIAIAQALSQAVGVSLDAIGCDGHAASEMVQALSSHTEELIQAREGGDWITVADIVEYDLAPALQQWPQVFETLRRSIAR